MSCSEENVEILTDFGLTGNQAKVYLAATRLRLAPVGKISKVSKVRREDVYRILPKLEKMGLAEKLIGTPAKIRAAPVKEALSILIKNEEDTARERLSTLKAKKETFLTHFTRLSTLEVEEETHFALLSNLESITSKMLNMVKKAEREFEIACSGRKLMQFIHTFADQIKRITKKGIRVRVISDLAEYEDSLSRVIEECVPPGNSIDLKYADLPSCHYMIVDFKEALISTTTEGNMGDNPCLWTNSDSLVGVFQKDFENLWHDSISWENIETTAVPEKVIGFMEQLRPTNHVTFVYDNQEGKHNVLFNYLKVGLDKGEAGVYVASDEKPNQIREAMKQFGIKVEEYEKTDALHIFGYEDIYIRDGKFSLTATLDLWNKLYNEALKNGFKGLRVTGETACFFNHDLIKELLEYEKALHKVVDIPMIAVCAYNAGVLNRTDDTINLYNELARAHGTVLFTGIDNRLGRMEIRKV